MQYSKESTEAVCMYVYGLRLRRKIWPFFDILIEFYARSASAYSSRRLSVSEISSYVDRFRLRIAPDFFYLSIHIMYTSDIKILH